MDVFRPYVATAADRDHASGGRSYGLHVVGRLRPGATLEQARADVERVNAAVRAAYPANRNIGTGTVVLSLKDRVVGPAKSWLLLVLAAVACVVVVGCVNAASLLLARATVRSRELATRAALGASRGRLARTLLLEGLVLACAASVAAILLSLWGVGFAKARLPENLVRVSTIAIDARVLFASIAAAVLCGVLAGGPPAWRISRCDLFEHIKMGGAVIGGRRQQRSLGAFLVAEVAFVTILLVATTLAVTSFIVVTTADLGFDRHDVMTIYASHPMPNVAKSDRQAAAAVFFADLLDRVRAVPGVKAAGLVSGGSAPLSGTSVRYSVVIPGVGELRGADMFETRGASPEYFAAMGILGGRTVPEARFVGDDFRRFTAGRRFNAGLMGVFGMVAVVIGAIGIYGTMAFVVAQQGRAIGLRMALGASRSNVIRSILSEALGRVTAGAAVGLVGARIVASLFTSLVFGVQTTSPAVYAAVGLGLAAVGVLAAFVPALRAARLDPLAALRSE